MGVPVSQAESVSAPSGTGTTIAITLPAHQEDDVLIVQVGWKGNQAPTTLTGWNHYFSQATGTATNGCGQGVWWRRVNPSETVSNPTLTIGTTAVERRAIAYCIRGADIDNPANTFWQKQQTVGNSTAPTPPGITTLAPNYLLLHLVTCRGNSAVTPPTGYNEEQDTAEGTTICVEGSTLTQTNAATISGQAATISSNRWVAAIIAIPSPDYPYFRSQTSQTATATSITGTLPTGTTAADFYGRKDLIIATVEAAGTAPSPNVGADWTSIATWETTTSGGATTIRQYWALYDGSISLQFNRTGSGEISLNLSVYRNPHQTVPIGNVNVRQNASSTTSTWDALTRSATKSTVAAMCVADGTPSYTAPASWTEREDGFGMTCADQIFEAGGSTASASFTLSTASPTATGLVEILSHAGTASGTTFERSAAISATASIASVAQFFTVFSRTAAIDGAATVAVSGQFFSVLTATVAVSATATVTVSGMSERKRSASVSATADVSVSGARVVDRSASLDATASVASSGESFTIFEASAAVSAVASTEASGVSFSVVESAVSVNAAAAIEVAGVGIVERALSLDATAAVESSANFFTVVSSAVQVDAAAVITSSVEFFSIFERQLAVDATAEIFTSRQVELARTVSLSAVADIAVTGGIKGGVFEHERSATISASGAIESVALSFSVIEAASAVTASATVIASGLTVRERAAQVTATVAISTTAQRDLLRSTTFTATTGMASSGDVSGTAVERAATVAATASIAVSATFQHPPSLRRTFVVESEQRTSVVRKESRLYKVDRNEREEAAV